MERSFKMTTKKNNRYYENLKTPKDFHWLEYQLSPIDKLEEIIFKLEMNDKVLDFAIVHNEDEIKAIFEIKATEKVFKDLLNKYQLTDLTVDLKNRDIVNMLVELCKLNQEFNCVIFCSNLAKTWITFKDINDMIRASKLGLHSFIQLKQIMKVHPYSDFNFPIINSEFIKKKFKIDELITKNAEAEKEIENCNKEIARLQKYSNMYQSQLQDVKDRKLKAEQKLSQVYNEYNPIYKKLKHINNQISSIENKIENDKLELEWSKNYLHNELSQNLENTKTQISNIASEIRRHNQFQYDNYATKRTLTGTLMSNAFPESLTDSLDFSVTKNVIGLLNLNKDESKLTNDEKTPPVVYLLIGQDKESSTEHPKFLMKIGSANNFYKRSVVYKTNASEDNENNHFKMGSVVFLKNILIPRNGFNPLNNEWLIRHLFEKWLKKNDKTQLVDSKLGNEFFKYDINALQELDRIFENFKNNQYKYENELAEIDKAYQAQDNTMKRKLQNQFVKRHFDELI